MSLDIRIEYEQECGHRLNETETTHLFWCTHQLVEGREIDIEIDIEIEVDIEIEIETG
jgi:hypothetical protein